MACVAYPPNPCLGDVRISNGSGNIRRVVSPVESRFMQARYPASDLRQRLRAYCLYRNSIAARHQRVVPTFGKRDAVEPFHHVLGAGAQATTPASPSISTEMNTLTRRDGVGCAVSGWASEQRCEQRCDAAVKTVAPGLP